MKLGGIFCVAQLLGSCIAYPLEKRAKPQLMPLLSDDVWNEMLEWQSVWIASNDFQSLGIDEELVSKINGFLHFSEAFLRKAYNDQHQQVQDLCVLNVKQSKLKKIKTNVTKWKGKLNDIMQIRKDIKMDQKQGKMKPDRLIGELDKLKNIVASYVEQTNNLPIVTILRIVAANLDHQMVKLRELIEKQGENLDKNTEDMLQQTENVIRIAEMLIRTVDEIRATSVDQFIQDNVGDANTYLGALNDVQYNDSMAIVNEMNNAEISQENEYEVEDYVYKHATSRIKKVFTWFNTTTSVPSDFYFKNNDKQLTLISLKLFSYIAYQTIGGTMYCILELATPKSISAWDNCGNFHSAQLRKEWILLSVLLSRISNPLKDKDPSAFALASAQDLLCQ